MGFCSKTENSLKWKCWKPKILSRRPSNGRVTGIDQQPYQTQQIYCGHFSAMCASRNLCYCPLIIQMTGINEIWCVPVSPSVNCSVVKLTFCTKPSLTRRVWAESLSISDSAQTKWKVSRQTKLQDYSNVFLFYFLLKPQTSSYFDGGDLKTPSCEEVINE